MAYITPKKGAGTDCEWAEYRRVTKRAISDNIEVIGHQASLKLNNPSDRVRVMQWVLKIKEVGLECDQKRMSKSIVVEYADFLRLILDSDPVIFVHPFKHIPPEKLSPLAEVLGNEIARNIPSLPRTGPLQPVLCHKSEDGKAFMTVKKCPNGGVYCYMAVTPEQFIDFDLKK